MDTFNKYSKLSSDNETLNNSLLIRQKQLKTFYQYIKEFKQTNTNTTQNFMKAYSKLLINFNSVKKYEVREFLAVFTFNTSSYIFDLFNTNELKNEKNIAKEMKKIYIKQLMKILDYYKDILEKNITKL